MNDKRTYVMAHDLARTRAIEAVRTAPAGYVITVSPARRNLDQNAAMWAMLTEVAQQLPWHGRMLTPEQWKHIFSSSLKKQDVVPNLEGDGFVVMGIATSSMSKAEMSEMLELIQAFGAQHDVQFTQ